MISEIKEQLRTTSVPISDAFDIEVRLVDAETKFYDFLGKRTEQLQCIEWMEANHFTLGIWFPPSYLVRAESFVVVKWFEPWTVFHPNIRPPLMCVGRIVPGMPLVDLLYQCFEIITYNKVTMREDDALNREACAWARRNVERFPIDRRPLKRRALDLHIEPVAGGRPV